MSILDLVDYISYLKNNQLQTERQVVALWRKMAYPFTLLVMITIAAPIGFMQTRSEEHTSELQSLMRISYAGFCLKKKRMKSRRTTKMLYNEKYITKNDTH